MCSPIRPAQQLVHLGDDDVEVQHHGLEHLPATVGQQLASERGGPLDAFRISSTSPRLLSPGGSSRSSSWVLPRIAVQQVVEVVRDAPRELAHRLHLLRLPELLFEVPLVGDVALRAPHPHEVPVLDEAHDIIKEDAGAALAVVLASLGVGTRRYRRG